MPSPERPALGEAIALGLLHGPAELLPISSSGHTELVPWLLDWSYPGLDPELRKSFEVALHAGTAAALLIALRGEVREAVAALGLRAPLLLALASVPPALAGLALEGPIERRLGTPGSIALGLIAGSLALAAADRRPPRRAYREAGVRDALSLGLAQACALMPGVSRNGATLAAARRLGFHRTDANRLSRHTALPVIAGATLLRIRRAGRELPPEARGAVLAGTAAAFVSTLASTRLIGAVERDRSPAPFVAYRLGLAALTLTRLGRIRRPRESGEWTA